MTMAGKDYYARNREKVLAHVKTYYAMHRDEILERQKAWYHAPENRERAISRARDTYYRRKAAGICTWCGQDPAEEGRTMCAACAEYKRRSKTAMKDRRQGDAGQA